MKKEERKKAKKEKKAKETSKPQQEEKISLTYSKKELKKAEEIKREKQREKSLQQKKRNDYHCIWGIEKEEKKQTVITEVKEENEVTEMYSVFSDSHLVKSLNLTISPLSLSLLLASFYSLLSFACSLSIVWSWRWILRKWID